MTTSSDTGQGNEVYAIERIAAADISPEDFTARFVSRCMPIILTGAIESWPAYQQWSLEWFQEKHGNTEVSVDWGIEGPDRWRKMRLAEYLAAFPLYKEGSSSLQRVPYLRTWNVLDDLPELEGTFHAPGHFEDGFQRLAPSSRPPFEWLFIGPAGAKTVMHEDIWGTDAWLAQVQGRKHFMLYHPAHRRHLEVDGSFVDPADPDLATFPDFIKATAVEAILHPGEVIYIPRRWPHYVVGLDDTISITVNFLSRANHKLVVDSLAQYMQRRKTCERILGRPLRARDNLMKFCCHGGRLPVTLAKQMLSAVGALGEDRDDSSDEDESVSADGKTTEA